MTPNGKTRLVIVLHNHQPIGNFDKVFEQAYRKSYLPFLDVVEGQKHFRFGLHISGPLLEWLEQKAPDYLDRLGSLVKAGSLEILGGSFYEAIPIMLSDRDRMAQFELMNSYVENRFGKAPTGMWLPERVWEQSVAHDIAAAGLKYTLLDDHHFKLAGIPESQLTGYYSAEDRGKSIAVFPISEKLRYLIPFAEPSETIAHIEKFKTKNAVLCYGDDGEKFGLWPHTFHAVYKEGWLKRFCAALKKASATIEMCLPSKVLTSVPPVGRAYLPDCSYREMTEWALPVHGHKEMIVVREFLKQAGFAKTAEPFIKGGSWRGFRARYPESANMSALQSEISACLQKIEDDGTAPNVVGEARTSLLRAQCDCAYWHGVFGGLYLPHLRDAVYANLIAAQELLSRTGCLPSIERGDFDLDLAEDIRMFSDGFVAYIKPSKGGMVRGFNVLKAGVNLANVLARHPEEYHDRVAGAVIDNADPDSPAESIHHKVSTKEVGLEKYLVYDWHERGMFQEHFIPAATTIESFRWNRYNDEGDFTVEPYRVVSCDKKKITLSRSGGVWQNGKHHPLEIRKEYSATSRKLKVRYAVTNKGAEKLELRLGVESNFGMSADNAFTHYYFDESGQLGPFKLVASLADRSMIGLKDDWRKFEAVLGTSKPAHLWLFPIYTVSQSEGGFEKVFQSAVVMPIFHLAIKPGMTSEFEITVEVKSW